MAGGVLHRDLWPAAGAIWAEQHVGEGGEFLRRAGLAGVQCRGIDRGPKSGHRWREEISNVPDRHQFAEKHSGEGSRSESRTLYLRRWTAGDPLDGGAHRDRMVIRAKPDRATLVWRMFFESDAA